MAYYSLSSSLLCRLAVLRLHVAFSASGRRHTHRSLSSAQTNNKPNPEKHHDAEHNLCSPSHLKSDNIDTLKHQCASCSKLFVNQQSLEMHLRPSALHNKRANECIRSVCKKAFVSFGDMARHCESGACQSGIDRHNVNELAVQHDAGSIITHAARLAWGAKQTKPAVSEASWSGEVYACPLCPKGFVTLSGLEAHLHSPVHDAEGYQCPSAHHGCGREFKTLSSLLHHVERGSCGVTRLRPQVKTYLHDITSKLRSGGSK